jgi:tRNA A-37 threonylcarbamoyl transferase component Bud32
MQDKEPPDNNSDETRFDPVEEADGARTGPGASAAHPAEGDSPSRRFRLGRELGEGGMAVVLEAEDSRLERTVAVKRLRPEPAERAEQRRRFFQEAKILGGLAHPGVVAVYDVGTLERGEPFYAMEKVQGETLADLLRARTSSEIANRSALLKLIDIFERVCQTVAYAHSRNTIHRDLKPGNIMVDRFGAVFVMDWGIAKRVSEEESPFVADRTRAGVFMGTPAYSSPEQARGLAEASDFGTDVFALGVILYQILTGELPFRGRSLDETLKEVVFHEPAPPQTLNRRVGRELSAICMKALAKDPRRRYADAGALAEDVRRFREFLPVSAIRPRLVDHVGNWARRRKVLAAVLGTLLFVVVVGGVELAVRTYTERLTLERVLSVVQATQEEIERMESKEAELRGRLARTAPGDGSRPELMARFQELRARIAIREIENRNRLAAVIGFSFGSPDPRALELARWQTFQIADRMIANENLTYAQVFVESVLTQVEEGNVLSFTSPEIGRLRELLVRIESRQDVEGARPAPPRN